MSIMKRGGVGNMRAEMNSFFCYLRYGEVLVCVFVEGYVWFMVM